MNKIYTLAFFLVAINLQAQSRFDKVSIKTIQITDKVFMLQGAGGNIGVSIGENEVFVIDDQFAPLSAKIIGAIKKLSQKPLKFLVNTHFHGDHTGGNENMTNEGATIIAHNNVKKRLKLPNRQGKIRDKSALPVITFNDKLNITINSEEVMVFHASNAHTDGDALLYFTESNVLHTGDTFFKDRYPYIDLSSGGSVSGYIEAVRLGLLLVDDETKIIPGHGNLATRLDYQSFYNMLVELKTKVLKEISDGKTEDEVTNDDSITKKYDALGMGSGFINSKRIRNTFYKSLKN